MTLCSKCGGTGRIVQVVQVFGPVQVSCPCPCCGGSGLEPASTTDATQQGEVTTPKQCNGVIREASFRKVQELWERCGGEEVQEEA